MDSTTRLRQRSEKLKEQLESLKKEVNVANVYLKDIVDKSDALVTQLETTKNPQIYLREYTKVQKFLLNYVHLITEINCNLELVSDEEQTELVLEEVSPNVTASTDFGQIITEEKEEKVAEDVKKDKVDPKTEFKEKVQKLVTEEKSSKVLDPKSWTDAPPFVPKSSTETAQFVPKKTTEVPEFVPKVVPEVSPYAPQGSPYVPKPGLSNGTVVPKIPVTGTMVRNVPSSTAMYAPPPVPIRPVTTMPSHYQFQLFYNVSTPPPPGMMPSVPMPVTMQGLPLWRSNPFSSQQAPSVTRRPATLQSPVVPSSVSIKEVEEEKKVSEEKSKVEEKVEPVQKKVEPAEKNVEKGEKQEVKVEKNAEPPAKVPEIKEEPKKPAEVQNEVMLEGTIPDMNISREPGAKYQVVFDHLVSPGEFYIQILCPELTGMREMCKEIEVHFKTEKPREQPYQSKNLKNKDKKALAKKFVGNFGFAFTVDDPSWGRVEIKDWKLNEDNDEISVFFIDYGDTKSVSLNNLQPMVSKFKKYPKFAQRCHLANIYPPDAISGEPMPPWSIHCTAMFEVLLQSMPNDFSCHIIVSESDGVYDKSSLPVQFFVVNMEISTNINDRMVEFTHAKVLDPPPLPSDPNFKSEKRPLVGSLEVTTAQNLQIGELIPIQVTCLLKLNRFYCVKECGDAEEDILSKLVQYMNKPENVNRMLPVTDPPEIGQLVVGKYTDDDLWYRARIVKSDPVSDRYKLLFLDYGNTEVLPLKHIRKMEKKFLGFPFQLIECFLYGVEPAEKSNSEDGMKYFYSKVEKGGLNIKICEKVPDKDNCYQVVLYNEDGDDIGEDLVVSRFAVKKKT